MYLDVLPQKGISFIVQIILLEILICCPFSVS
jgi:hypothetical protein